MWERYDLICKIFWFATATESAPICPERLNPLIKQMYDKLKNYVFKEGTILARLVDLDDFWTAGYTNTKCKGGYSCVVFDCIDTGKNEGQRIQRMNDYIRGAIIRDLQKWEFSHYKTTLKIVDVTFS